MHISGPLPPHLTPTEHPPLRSSTEIQGESLAGSAGRKSRPTTHRYIHSPYGTAMSRLNTLSRTPDTDSPSTSDQDQPRHTPVPSSSHPAFYPGPPEEVLVVDLSSSCTPHLPPERSHNSREALPVADDAFTVSCCRCDRSGVVDPLTAIQLTDPDSREQDVLCAHCAATLNSGPPQL